MKSKMIDILDSVRQRRQISFTGFYVLTLKKWQKQMFDDLFKTISVLYSLDIGRKLEIRTIVDIVKEVNLLWSCYIVNF